MGVTKIESRLPKCGKPALTCCAPEGIRTPNLLIRSQMLYPLSYRRLARGAPQDCTRIAERAGGSESLPAAARRPVRRAM